MRAMKGKFQGKSFTIFVDNLPEKVNNWWLRRAFSRCGVVVDAFIPLRRRKVLNTKFGFVRFKHERDAVKATHWYDGISWMESILKVKMASFTSPSRMVWRRKRFQLGENEKSDDAISDRKDLSLGQMKEQ